MANGRLDDELAAFLKAKIDPVKDLASDPSAFGNAGNNYKPHSSGFADCLKNGRDDSNRAYRIKV
jgi:hypothetical protein